jgi:hypothetical protein
LVVPLIEKLGRKPLLVVPMILMIIDFVLLTVCLNFIDYYDTADLRASHLSLIKGLSFSSIVFIILFIMCFAVSLGE